MHKIIIVFLLISINGMAQQKTDSPGTFSFGVIADCQYCSDPGTGARKYAQSVDKLDVCVKHFNTLDLEFVVHLGDFIDRDFESFDVVGPVYAQLKAPKYHVLGNHDFSVADDKKALVPAKMNMPSKYYDFEIKGWRFVVLNGNDISFHGYPEGSKEYEHAATYYEENKISSPKWNGGMGDAQLNWLKKVLKKASKNHENVVLYSHFPIFPENVHNLWNANEVLELIEKYPCVKAYVNGHNHAGNYGVHAGIHYVTMKGMVDTEETSYAVIHVTADSMEIEGFGREENRDLKLRE